MKRCSHFWILTKKTFTLICKLVVVCMQNMHWHKVTDLGWFVVIE